MLNQKHGAAFGVPPKGKTVPVSHSAVAAPMAGSLLAVVGQYVALTKPRIILLLLVTTVPTMFQAADGVPNAWLVLSTLVGGSLAAGGAGAINSYVDRERD